MPRRVYVTEAIKDAVGRICANCGSLEDLTYHHIVPLAYGGNDIPSNMVCLCGRCHDAIHYGDRRGRISHSDAARAGIKAAQARGVRFGKAPADYESIMRMIAEHSTQFNASSLTTEAEIMRMAGVRATTYYKAKRMLLAALAADPWPYSWCRPSVVRSSPRYQHEIERHRVAHPLG